jgi:hypothetical protein
MGRRVGAWLVAAAVTAALVVGGVVVAAGGGRRALAPAVLPPLELDGAQATAAAGTAAAAAQPARAGVARARPYDTGDVPNLWAPANWRVRGTLPELPDRARAWKLGSEPAAGRLAALAGTLGLGTEVKLDPAGWTVTEGGRSLRVNRLGGLPFSYSFGAIAVGGCGPWSPRTPAGGGVQCLAADTPTTKPGAPATKPAKPPVAVPGRLIRPMPRPADLPSRQDAERIARDLATKAGLALDGAAVTVTDGYAARVVTISPAVGGLPTHGFAWTVGVGPKGRVQYASGWLATPEPADTYPLIGVTAGLERLRRQPAYWPPLLRPAAKGAIVERPCPPDTRVPCLDKPPAKRTITVTGVRLGLQLAPGVPKASRPAGTSYLLPAYLFDVEGGFGEVRSVIAVQDRYLAPPPKLPLPARPQPARP